MKRFIPALWLVVFFAIPFLAVIKLSFSTLATAIPPYTPVFDLDVSTWLLKAQSFSVETYVLIFSDTPPSCFDIPSFIVYLELKKLFRCYFCYSTALLKAQ